jgi:uncharacterized protein (DUF885 family)
MSYNFMRLRALRVEVDVRLAIGEFTIDQAADYLERIVPVDRATARQEAVFFASSPGQAITYQIGKLQIVKFLADARLNQKEKFSLRPSMTICGRTATCRLRCCVGNIWG